MKKLAVLFGGKTCEHDVSIVTGLQLMENVDTTKYEIIPIYIDRGGKWYAGDQLRNLNFLQKFDPAKVTEVIFPASDGCHELLEAKPGLLGKRKVFATIDITLPAMHGMNGEDGSLQGLFELANIPYVGSGLLGSSVGMDKAAMRIMFKGAGLPVLPSVCLSRAAWEDNPDTLQKQINKSLQYPVFVKPANLGSSIGISKVNSSAELANALSVAFGYDRRVVVEQGIDCTEINCSALGFGQDVSVSMCEQPVSWKDFLTFDEKYLSGGKQKGMASVNRIIPAPLTPEKTQEIQRITHEIFSLLDCRGVVRIDFMIDNATDQLYVNEINTIPGSFAFYLWEPAGIPYKALINKLIDFAYAANREKNANVYAFDSNMLTAASAGAKSSK